jgi:hypothetical protein
MARDCPDTDLLDTTISCDILTATFNLIVFNMCMSALHPSYTIDNLYDEVYDIIYNFFIPNYNSS